MDRPARRAVMPGEGPAVSLGGIGVVFKIDGSETGAAFSIVEHPVEPGALVPPHVHTREDEYSFVLEGEVGARIGDRDLSAGPGAYILKPRGIPHTFWNAGSTPARLLEIISPAGFERYFEEKVGELAARYDLAFVHPEWVPDLTAKYGVSLLGR